MFRKTTHKQNHLHMKKIIILVGILMIIRICPCQIMLPSDFPWGKHIIQESTYPGMHDLDTGYVYDRSYNEFIATFYGILPDTQTGKYVKLYIINFGDGNLIFVSEPELIEAQPNKTPHRNPSIKGQVGYKVEEVGNPKKLQRRMRLVIFWE